jgi:hypothetical protein
MSDLALIETLEHAMRCSIILTRGPEQANFFTKMGSKRAIPAENLPRMLRGSLDGLKRCGLHNRRTTSCALQVVMWLIREMGPITLEIQIPLETGLSRSSHGSPITTSEDEPKNNSHNQEPGQNLATPREISSPATIEVNWRDAQELMNSPTSVNYGQNISHYSPGLAPLTSTSIVPRPSLPADYNLPSTSAALHLPTNPHIFKKPRTALHHDPLRELSAVCDILMDMGYYHTPDPLTAVNSPLIYTPAYEQTPTYHTLATPDAPKPDPHTHETAKPE